MKQTITQQRELTWQHYIRLYGLILTFLFAGLISIQAQTVAWTSGYPKLSPTTLTALDDPGYLDVYFTPTLANITNGKLEVTLPAGITYQSIENGAGHTGSITYGTPVVSGQTVTISFTSNSGTLSTGAAVFVRLKVSAVCSAVNGATATVKVLSGASVVNSGQQPVTIGVQIPTIRVQCTAPIQNYATQSELKDFELSLDAPNAPASSFLLILTGDQYSTLSNFTLDGALVTPVSSNVLSGSTKVTTIKLTTSEMGGKLGTTIKKLKFSAGNTRCGSRNISTSVQYSATVNCNTQVGATLTMSFPSVAGLPKLDFQTWGYYDLAQGSIFANYQFVPKNLSKIYLKISYKNNGTADAYNVWFNSMGMYSERYAFGFIDEKNIQYDINGGALQTIPAANAVGSGSVGNNASAGYVKPEYASKYIRANVSFPEIIPVGATVTFWIPAYIGAIYDNGTKNVFLNYWTRADWGYWINSTYCENLCSESTTSPFVAGGYVNDIFFKEVPSQLIVNSGDLVTQKILVAANSLSSSPTAYSVAEVVLDMPDWMELETGNEESDIIIQDGAGNSLNAIISGTGTSSTSGGISRYSVKFANINSSSVYLAVKYKAGACQSTTANQEGTIGYHINWQLGQPSASNPSLDNSSQVFQPVTMLCKKDGIQLDNFQTIRTTRGLRDISDNGIPDDGSEALETEINNEYYQIGHKGYFKWEATVLGSSSDTYIHWYAPVTLTSISLNHIVPSSGTATIQVNGGTAASVSYTKVDDYHFYLHYDASSSPLKGGDQIEVQFPFEAKTTTNVLYDITSECFVSNIAFADPFSSLGNINRHGEDKAGYSVAVFNDDISDITYNGAISFTDNTVRPNLDHGTTVYNRQGYASKLGYFKNEVMRKYYPKQIVYTVPQGYRLVGNLTMAYYKKDAPSPINITVTPTITGNTYTYDIGSFFDESYDGTGTLASGKYMVPDDRWQINQTPSVQATRSTFIGTSTVKRTVTLRNVQSNSNYSLNEVSGQYLYSGLATTLSLSTSTLPAYGANLSIPVVTIGNPTAISLNKMWLYVEGNVSNISITPSGGGTAISGTGHEGRWIEVSNTTMAPGDVWNYKMDFTYGGSNDCSIPDKVTVYTVSGFEDPSWNPTSVTGAAINMNDIMHNGACKSLNITAAPAKIEGKIETSTQTVSFNIPYNLKVTLDSRSSQGSVKDASMTVTIPAGQLYTPGSARVEYPLGNTPAAVPALLESALVTANSSLGTTRTVTFTSPILLSGYLAAGTDNDRQMVFTAEYKPQCETDLTGFNYTGILNGKTACGDLATGDGAEVFNPKMFANVTTNYNFTVKTAMKSANNAFNENRTSDVLKVTINKQSGIGINMLPTDVLSIRIPECFDMNGAASIPSGFGAGSVSTSSNTVTAGERIIELSLPISAFDGDPNKGIGQDVTFEIPLTYTANGQTQAATPVHSVYANVFSNGKFDASCPDAIVSIGDNGSMGMGIAVVTSSMMPFKTCLNSAVALDVTSAGFAGTWYVEEARTTSLGTGATYSYTPIVQADTIFFVSAVFNSVNYGTVPVAVELYDEATITVTNPAAICWGSSVNISSGTVSNTPVGSTVKYYSDAAGTTELTGAALTVSPTITTTYYAQVETTDGCKSPLTAITVTVNALPVITLTTDKTDDKVCVDSDITLTTESGMTGYTWNLGGATTTTSGGTSTDNTAVLQWNTSGTKTVTVNYTDANGCSAATAKSKDITVVAATTITTQPSIDPAIKLSNGYIIPGSNVNLNVVATGLNLTYQWYWKKLSDGTVVTLADDSKYSGTTTASLLISNAYEEENGDYYVTATGCGSATSNPVTVVAVANQDASLKDLKINGITLPDFNAAKMNYMTTVPCLEEEVTILGTPNNPNYTSITGNGTFHLEPGDNIFNIVVVAQDMVTTMTYTVNVIRDCYVPKILKDLEDAVICIGNTHTFEVIADGQGLTYEWYYGLNRIIGANTNTYTIINAKLGDYERYQVVIRSNYNGFKSSAYSKKARLWVADHLPTTLQFATCPNPAVCGETYHIKLAGYTDVTKYTWSYDKDGVAFSRGSDPHWGNEAWATFGTLAAGNGTLKVTMEHPCGTREITRAMTVKYPTGVEDVTTIMVQVYPNPTSGIVKVSNTEANQTIKVTDVTGSLKGTYKTQEGTTTIDLTGYAKGTYMVQYNGKTYKVIKK